MADSTLTAGFNLEGHSGYNIEWGWTNTSVPGGFTAVVRVKNEARNLPFVLSQLLRSVERVVLVDNESTDGTAEVATEVAAAVPGSDLEVVEYPFEVARCGSEHRGTPPDSVHSLTYFNNWAFSHVRTPYALKWDGDMILSAKGEWIFRELEWRLEGVDRVVTMPIHPVYVRSEAEAWIDLATTHKERYAWPNRPGYTFGKGLEWEIPLTPGPTRPLRLPKFICFEVKWLDENEFDHWTSAEEFEGSMRQTRKRREWDVFQQLITGDIPESMIPIETHGGQHVLDSLYSRRECGVL